MHCTLYLIQHVLYKVTAVSLFRWKLKPRHRVIYASNDGAPDDIYAQIY